MAEEAPYQYGQENAQRKERKERQKTRQKRQEEYVYSQQKPQSSVESYEAMNEGKAAKASDQWTASTGRDLMVDAVVIKYQQCSVFRDYLLRHKGECFVEATNYTVWGSVVDLTSTIIIHNPLCALMFLYKTYSISQIAISSSQLIAYFVYLLGLQTTCINLQTFLYHMMYTNLCQISI